MDADLDADHPFAGPPLAEVVLTSAPLSRVIAQVRYQTILALNEATGVAGFQEAIRAAYPVFRQEEAREVTMSPTGEIHAAPQHVWRFADAREESTVAVGTAFIALETSAYTTREPFLQCLDIIFRAAQNTFAPRLVDRIGLRYVNRVQGNTHSRIPELIRPEMLGLANGTMADYVQLNLTETNLKVPGGIGERMSLRHGLLPAQTTYDPGYVPVSGLPSWVLDIDTYLEGRIEFDATRLSEIAASLVDKSYRMFRWVVRDELLREYGGQL